ncbi:MAG: L-threonylcarbamoyladenylate synthase [Bacteroidales bacterium]|jgi:tRNA threonylcarbamoyl adenosine modification protein (Sua5/YciO/YrdC/YwlC family)|nr:L-threonylcarbamoyladenylate synthase [Bacteroidales bacterium]
MLLKIHSQGIEQKQIEEICNCLEKGGIIIYPTDTLYAFACKLGLMKPSERLAALKGKKFEKSNFSIVCNSISQASEFIKPISNNFFKLLKGNTPGAFTFVLEASTKIPKILQSKKKTIGIRIPDSEIALKIVEQLDYPIITTSLPNICVDDECFTCPDYFVDLFSQKVDLIIDNGTCSKQQSTVVSLINEEIEILRQGAGQLKY